MQIEGEEKIEKGYARKGKESLESEKNGYINVPNSSLTMMSALS